jgi:hypothetical protein
MSAAELTEWMAFYRIEAAERDERQAKADMTARAASGAHAAATAAIKRKKGHPHG